MAQSFEGWYLDNRFPWETRQESKDRYQGLYGVQAEEDQPEMDDSEWFNEWQSGPSQEEEDEYVEDPNVFQSLGRGWDQLQASVGSVAAGPVAGLLEEQGLTGAGEAVKDWGEEVREENLAEAARIAPAKSELEELREEDPNYVRAKTKEQILAEDPESWYKHTPDWVPSAGRFWEESPTVGQLAEMAPTSIGPSVIASGVGLGLGFATGNPLIGAGAAMATGTGLTSAVVAGETYESIKENSIIRKELGVDPNKKFKDLSPEDKQKVDRIATDASQNSFMRRLYTAGAVEAVSYIPYGGPLARYLADVGLGTYAEMWDRELMSENAVEALVENGMPQHKVEKMQEDLLAMSPSARQTFVQAFVGEAALGGPFTAMETVAGGLDSRVDIPKTATKLMKKKQGDAQERLEKFDQERTKIYEKKIANAQSGQSIGDDLISLFAFNPEGAKGLYQGLKDTNHKLHDQVTEFLSNDDQGKNVLESFGAQIENEKQTKQAEKDSEKILREQEKLDKEVSRAQEKEAKAQEAEVDAQAKIKPLDYDADNKDNGKLSSATAKQRGLTDPNVLENMPGGLTKEEATVIGDEFKSKAKDKLKNVNYHYLSKSEQADIDIIRQKVREELGPARSEQEINDRADSIMASSEAFVDPNNNVYFIAENIRADTRADAASRMINVAFHETIGHFGLRQVMGGYDSKSYQNFINRFRKTNNKLVRKWATENDGQLYLRGEEGARNMSAAELKNFYDKKASAAIKFELAEEYIAQNFAEFGVKDPNIVGRIGGHLAQAIPYIRPFQVMKTFGAEGIGVTITPDRVNTVLAEIQQSYLGGKRNFITGETFAKVKADVYEDIEEEVVEEIGVEGEPEPEVKPVGEPEDTAVPTEPLKPHEKDKKTKQPSLRQEKAQRNLKSTEDEIKTLLENIATAKDSSSKKAVKEKITGLIRSVSALRKELGLKPTKEYTYSGVTKSLDKAFSSRVTGKTGKLSSSLAPIRKKTVPKRPALRALAEQYRRGDITESELRKEQAKIPIEPKTLPEARTPKQVQDVINKVQGEKTGSKRNIIGKEIKESKLKGRMVGTRQDIKAQEKQGEFIVTLHDKPQGGNVIGYGTSAHLKNVEFTTQPGVALDIAAGQQKTTIARMWGKHTGRNTKLTRNRANSIMDGTAKDAGSWQQIGMDPQRASYFYTMDGQPVVNADEVLHVGNLVLAKGLKKARSTDKQFQVKTPRTKETVVGKDGRPLSFSKAPRVVSLKDSKEAAKVYVDPSKSASFKGYRLEIIDALENEFTRGRVSKAEVNRALRRPRPVSELSKVSKIALVDQLHKELKNTKEFKNEILEPYVPAYSQDSRIKSGEEKTLSPKTGNISFSLVGVRAKFKDTTKQQEMRKRAEEVYDMVMKKGGSLDIDKTVLENIAYLVTKGGTSWGKNMEGKWEYEVSDDLAGFNIEEVNGKPMPLRFFKEFRQEFEELGNKDRAGLKKLLALYEKKRTEGTSVNRQISANSFYRKTSNIYNKFVNKIESKKWKLKDIYQHDELFKMYPHFDNYTLDITKYQGDGLLGYHNPSKKIIGTKIFRPGMQIDLDLMIDINGWKMSDENMLNLILQKDTMVHEMQHSIQSKEGWTQGSNNRRVEATKAEMFAAQKLLVKTPKIRQIVNDIRDMITGLNVDLAKDLIPEFNSNPDSFMDVVRTELEYQSLSKKDKKKEGHLFPIDDEIINSADNETQSELLKKSQMRQYSKPVRNLIRKLSTQIEMLKHIENSKISPKAKSIKSIKNILDGMSDSTNSNFKYSPLFILKSAANEISGISKKYKTKEAWKKAMQDPAVRAKLEKESPTLNDWGWINVYDPKGVGAPLADLNALNHFIKKQLGKFMVPNHKNVLQQAKDGNTDITVEPEQRTVQEIFSEMQHEAEVMRVKAMDQLSKLVEASNEVESQIERSQKFFDRSGWLGYISNWGEIYARIVEDRMNMTGKQRADVANPMNGIKGIQDTQLQHIIKHWGSGFEYSTEEMGSMLDYINENFFTDIAWGRNDPEMVQWMGKQKGKQVTHKGVVCKEFPGEVPYARPKPTPQNSTFLQSKSTKINTSKIALSRSGKFAIGSGYNSSSMKQRGLWKWQDKLSNKLTRRLIAQGTLNDIDLYLQLRRKAKGSIYQAEQAAGKLFDILKNTKQSDAIYKYFTTFDASSSAIVDPKEREAAKIAKKKIINIGNELVRKGLMGQSAIEAHGGKYLPRMYLKHLLNEDSYQALSSGKTPDLGYLENRKDIPKGIRELILGEVKDPAFLSATATTVPVKDMAMLDWLEGIATMGVKGGRNWVLPKTIVKFDMIGQMKRLSGGDTQLIKDLQLVDTGKEKTVSGQWLLNEGNRIEGMLKYLTLTKKKEALVKKLVDLMKDAGKKMVGEIDTKEYKSIPNSRKYGRLAGIAVKKEIYNDIFSSAKQNESKTNSFAEAVLGDGGHVAQYNSFWKWAKVSANPPSWVRNFVSNLVLMNLGGVPPWKIPTLMISAISDMIKFRKNGRNTTTEVAHELGLSAGTFSAVELNRMRDKFTETQRRLEKNTNPMKFLASARGTFGSFRDATSDIYGSIDTLGKVMMLKHYGIDGKSDNDAKHKAAFEAERWLFDYSNPLQSVKYLRNAPLGAPFMSFPSFVLPLLIETAITKPWKFAGYYGIGWGAKALFQSWEGVSDEEYEGLVDNLTDYLREKAVGGTFLPRSIIPLPILDDQNRAQFLDLGYLLPWGMFSELIRELDPTKREGPQWDDALATVGMMTGPVPNMIAAITTGKDPFSRYAIVDEFGTPGEKAWSWFHYIFNLSMPPMAHGLSALASEGPMGGAQGFGAIKRVIEAYTGTLTREGEARFTPAQAWARMVGMNVTPLAPMESKSKLLRFELSKVHKLKRIMSRRIEDLYRMGAPADKITEETEEFVEKLNEQIKVVNEKAEKPLPMNILRKHEQWLREKKRSAA